MKATIKENKLQFARIADERGKKYGNEIVRWADEITHIAKNENKQKLKNKTGRDGTSTKGKYYRHSVIVNMGKSGEKTYNKIILALINGNKFQVT